MRLLSEPLALELGLPNKAAHFPLILIELGALLCAVQSCCIKSSNLSFCRSDIALELALLLRRRLPGASMSAEAQQSPFAPRGVAWSPRTLMWLLGLAGLGCCVAMSMPQVHIVAFCVDLGYGPAVGAEMLALMLAGGVVSRVVSGLLADRLGGVITLLIGASLQAVALFFYLVFPGTYFMCGYLRDKGNTFHLAGMVFSFAFAIFCLTEVALQHEMIGTYYAFMLVVLFVLAQQHPGTSPLRAERAEG